LDNVLKVWFYPVLLFFILWYKHGACNP